MGRNAVESESMCYRSLHIIYASIIHEHILYATKCACGRAILTYARLLAGSMGHRRKLSTESCVAPWWQFHLRHFRLHVSLPGVSWPSSFPLPLLIPSAYREARLRFSKCVTSPTALFSFYVCLQLILSWSTQCFFLNLLEHFTSVILWRHRFLRVCIILIRSLFSNAPAWPVLISRFYWKVKKTTFFLFELYRLLLCLLSR